MHVQKRQQSPKPGFPWANYQYIWSMLADSGRSVRSGYTISRASRVLSSVLHCRSMIRSFSRRGARYVNRFRIAISSTDGSQNRMAESLVLFESVINSRWFLRTSIILFLNKIDVFKNKLPKVRPYVDISAAQFLSWRSRRFPWTSISPSIPVAQTSTRVPNTSFGDSCRRTVHG